MDDKYSYEKVCEAADALIRAEEVKADPRLAKLAAEVIDERRDALNAPSLDNLLKKIRDKSESDIKHEEADSGDGEDLNDVMDRVNEEGSSAEINKKKLDESRYTKDE